MATKTALEMLGKFSLKLRPCIIDGKVSGKGVTLKSEKWNEAGLAKFLSTFGLEAKQIKGGRYLIAVIQIDKFNAATADIPEQAAPPPVDLSQFENENEEDENEETEDED